MTERRTPFYDIHLRTSAQMIKGGGNLRRTAACFALRREVEEV